MLRKITDCARCRESLTFWHTPEDRLDVVGGSCTIMGGAFQNLADQERVQILNIVDYNLTVDLFRLISAEGFLQEICQS